MMWQRAEALLRKCNCANRRHSLNARVRARQALFVFYLHASHEEDKCLMNSVLGVKRSDVIKLHR